MTLAKVSKGNYLVEASYSLTLQEQRLILACLSKIDARNEAPKTIELTASEYSSLMNIDIKNAHRELYKAADRLYERSILVTDPDKTEEFRWVQKKVKYLKGEGRIKLFWSDDVMIYISQLKRRFTSYRLSDVAQLNTSYAIRLYELLMQFNSTKERYISLTKLREFFKLEEKYLLFRDFNKWVIKPSVNEINRASNLDVTYSLLKDGRNVSGLRFDFQEKRQQQFPFLQTEG